MLGWMAREVYVSCPPHGAAGPIGSDGVARSNTEACPAALALKDKAIRTQFYGFKDVAPSYLHTKFERAFFKEPLRHSLRQEQYEGKTRVER